MNISLFHNHYDEQHLEEVKQEMAKRGAPKIRAIWSEAYGMWMAVEGCHRIRAAKELGLTPIIDDITNRKSATIQIDDRNQKVNVADFTNDLLDTCWRRDYISFED